MLQIRNRQGWEWCLVVTYIYSRNMYLNIYLNKMYYKKGRHYHVVRSFNKKSKLLNTIISSYLLPGIVTKYVRRTCHAVWWKLENLWKNYSKARIKLWSQNGFDDFGFCGMEFYVPNLRAVEWNSDYQFYTSMSHWYSYVVWVKTTRMAQTFKDHNVCITLVACFRAALITIRPFETCICWHRFV